MTIAVTLVPVASGHAFGLQALKLWLGWCSGIHAYLLKEGARA